MEMPPDEIMRKLSQMALESATQQIAKHARVFATNLPMHITAQMALEAFADAIESTNMKVWPGGEKQ
jgi:hypothetical protein